MDDSKAIKIIQSSRLLDIDYYQKKYSIQASKTAEIVEHFFYFGARQGYNPNTYFNTKWYFEKNVDVMNSQMNPLLHYILFGEKEGRWPCPYFDPSWYKNKYRLRLWKKTALYHYLTKGKKELYSPSSQINVRFYLQENPDVLKANIDPVEHFIEVGSKEGRKAIPDENETPEKHALTSTPIHQIKNFIIKTVKPKKANKNSSSVSPINNTFSVASEIRKNVIPNSSFENFDASIAQQRSPTAKVIAFYLPQFYSFKENDEWWGKGFTEWTNVSKGVPRFVNHYQPRIPRDLGFYNLSSKTTIKKQIKLASDAGLHGFCYYYYWFNQKRLLDKPLDLFVEMEGNDFPFCLMWANENWTRSWDGLEKNILMHQDYREEDEDALLTDLYHYFSQENYIKVNNRPLFIIYRPTLIPESKETFSRWRKKWKEQHNIEPLLLMVQGFGDNDPELHGLDGAVEFPPHKLSEGSQHIPYDQLNVLDSDFSGAVVSYDTMINNSLTESPPDFPLIKSVTPSWDNDARREGYGYTVTGSTPKKYQNWLSSVIKYAQKKPFYKESFVFVNAWNEWAEGAYLEPDVHYGSAYLNATARAIANIEEIISKKMKVLLIGHDAHPHGAQMLLINIAKVLKFQFGIEVSILLLEGGKLLDQYKEIADVSVVSPNNTNELVNQISSYQKEGFNFALTNTTVTGAVVPALKKAQFSIVSLIHELPQIIEEMKLSDSAKKIAKYSDKIIFPSEVVSNGFNQVVKKLQGEKIIRPQGVYNPIHSDNVAREQIRQKLGLTSDDTLIINVGYADLRKGFDIFVNTASYFEKTDPSVHFLWLGNIALDMQCWIQPKENDTPSNFHHIPYVSNVIPFFSAADIFFLTSREDPFPSVVLEAFQIGLPVIGLKDSGGLCELISQYGDLVDKGDIQEISNTINKTIKQLDSSLGEKNKKRRKALIEKEFQFDDYCFDLLRNFKPELKKISVILPNYNYAKYLKKRLWTLFNQSYPIFEIIVLDDCSTDNSMKVINKVKSNSQRAIHIHENEKNSGNVFKQWAKGINIARGEYIWIAEADDEAEPLLCASLVQLMNDKTSFAYTDSKTMDNKGEITGDSYKFYYDTIAKGDFEKSFVIDGKEFIKKYLSVKNLILNASAVIWKKDILQQCLDEKLDEVLSYSLAGDWFLYIEAAKKGNVAYCSNALNIHRRHDDSVTSSLDKDKHIDEISRIHNYITESIDIKNQLKKTMYTYRKELHETL